jgi:ubiquinone/menaquinone biosynthesis C-methylase UbiE
MKNFDAAALSYDTLFTHSNIGKAQRLAVYSNITPFLESKKWDTILEVNCGTGEDAIWLSKFSNKILATDQSSKMIEIAMSKVKNQNNINFQVLDCNEIDQINEPIDLIFSNFGGLNCLDSLELKKFIKNSRSILVPNGKIIMVVMPKNTIWEQFYFLLKFEWKKIFRRKKEFSNVLVENSIVKTYYYNSNEIINWSKENYNFVSKFPIGFFVPPSYLEPFAKRNSFFFKGLVQLDLLVKKLSFLSNFADHYLLILEKK